MTKGHRRGAVRRHRTVLYCTVLERGWNGAPCGRRGITGNVELCARAWEQLPVTKTQANMAGLCARAPHLGLFTRPAVTAGEKALAHAGWASSVFRHTRDSAVAGGSCKRLTESAQQSRRCPVSLLLAQVFFSQLPPDAAAALIRFSRTGQSYLLERAAGSS